jgi:hypothetical protein
MSPQIYLDMDGVMADFVGAVLDTWRLSVPSGSVLGVPVRRRLDESDIDAWAIEDRLGVRRDDFWQTIGLHSWWADLEAYPWATPLFEMLSFYGGITYLSSPSKSLGTLSGKLDWIQRRHGRGFTDWIFTNHKEHVAGPGKILIDDSEKNCDAWESKGGYAILFPQYWNVDRVKRSEFGRSDRMTGVQIQGIVGHIQAELVRALA